MAGPKRGTSETGGRFTPGGLMSRGAGLARRDHALQVVAGSQIISSRSGTIDGASSRS